MVAFVLMLSSGLFLVGVYFYTHIRRLRLKQLRLGFFMYISIAAMLVSIILVTFKYKKTWPGILFDIPIARVDTWLDEISIIAAIVLGVLLWVILLWRLANWVFNLLLRKKRRLPAERNRG